jgi:hypothetical protein
LRFFRWKSSKPLKQCCGAPDFIQKKGKNVIR